jgi:hypothetical protein
MVGRSAVIQHESATKDLSISRQSRAVSRQPQHLGSYVLGLVPVRRWATFVGLAVLERCIPEGTVNFRDLADSGKIEMRAGNEEM